MRTISPKAGEKFISTAMRLTMQGKIEGIEAGIKKVAFALIKQGVSVEIILKATNLSQEQLDYLRTLDEFNIDLDNIE